MNAENITAEIVFGDISDPENLNKMLFEKHGIRLGDLLNTRTFLDPMYLSKTIYNRINN